MLVVIVVMIQWASSSVSGLEMITVLLIVINQLTMKHNISAVNLKLATIIDRVLSGIIVKVASI